MSDEPWDAPCDSFAGERSICASCFWPYNFHPFEALSLPPPPSRSPRSAQDLRQAALARPASGVWGARPSPGAMKKRQSALLSSPRLSGSAGGPGGPPNKPLPVPVFSREPKEVAALLRRQLRTGTALLDGVEYEGVFAATDLVLTLMHHCRWTRAERCLGNCFPPFPKPLTSWPSIVCPWDASCLPSAISLAWER